MKLLKKEFLFVAGGLLILSSCNQNNASETNAVVKEISPKQWIAPDTSSIPFTEEGNLIRYGRDLIVLTSHYLGPEGIISHTTNGMNCQNCHLNAGTKIFGNNYSAVASTYPKYRKRSGKIESIEDRVNDCMVRSLNGVALDSSNKEMRAIVQYIKWVGSEVKKDSTPNGAGIMKVPLLERAADAERGKIVFTQKCVSCHGADGQGKKDTAVNFYLYPPLWGTHSFNTGAGLLRLSNFAGFVKANMPFGTNYDEPKLSDEEAWDVAAYVNSQPRPLKKFSGDWPDVSKKPFDYPFSPYADTFSEKQHKFGPWQEIVSAQKKK